MADFQQNFLASLHGGMDFGQRMKGIGDQSKLNQLAARSYSAPPEQRDALLSQMASVDAGSAFEAEQQMANSDQRRNTSMVNMARLLTNAPQQARAGLYRSMVPALSRFGMQDLPQDYNEQTAPLIDQAAQSIVQAYQDIGGTPTDVRSFQMMTAGLSPEDQMRARRINLGLDGRASSSGYSQVKFTGADGRERIGVLNGKTGQIDLPDGTSFNPQTGAISATPGAAQGVPQAGMYDTPNGRVSIGEGLTPAQWQAVQADVANNGGSDSYQLPSQNVQRPSANGAFVGRSPEEQAALTEQAKSDVQLRNLPTELSLRTQADIEKARGVEQAKTEAERAAQAPKRIKQYEQAIASAGTVGTSIDKAIGMIGPTTTGWSGARLRNIEGTDAYNLASEIETIKANLGFDRLQQMRDNSPTGGALGAIAVQELVALQSTIANLDPNQSDDQLKSNLQRVKQHYGNWVSAVQQSLADERAQKPTDVQPGGGRTIVRTGTSNGRKVVQYSDGSVEYGN